MGVTGDEWDGNANLLGVKNGVVNLMTGEPVQPSPDQYIRTVAPVPYIPGAKCPLWKKTLDGIFDGDPEKKKYLKELLGYAMSGASPNPDFIIWYGKDGRNVRVDNKHRRQHPGASSNGRSRVGIAFEGEVRTGRKRFN
ncbi:MAG: hypothetical protein R2932_09960 [Caldilineaceae bacterium]